MLLAKTEMPTSSLDICIDSFSSPAVDGMHKILAFIFGRNLRLTFVKLAFLEKVFSITASFL
jgi:hypothetical protein